MADKEKRSRMKKTNQYIDDINQRMDDLYQTTYSATPTNKKDVKNITQDIEDTIRQIIQRNPGTNVSNIVSMYSRMKVKQEMQDKATVEKINDFFNDQSLTSGLLQDYMANRWIKELKNEIDTVCKYMPKLQDAMDILKYATLTSDSYSKDFLSVSTMNYNSDETSLFVNRFEALKKKYKIKEKISEYYDMSSKYGEQMVYRVPYSKEIKNLLQKKATDTKSMINMQHIGLGSTNEVTIYESDHSVHTDNLFDNADKDIKSAFNGIKIVIDRRGYLESAIEETALLETQIPEFSKNSLHEQFVNEAKSSLDKTISDDLEIPKGIENVTNDGLVTKDRTNSNIDNIKIPGCIIKPLLSENLLLMYVEDICLGYYYFEFKGNGNNFDQFSTKLSSRTNLSSGATTMDGNMQERGDDYLSKMMNYISSYLANNIDADFVNKNENLQKEIYAILKHNNTYNDISTTEMIKITFIPADDITHFFFERDPDTHRGVSDLARGLIPAKLAACISVTDAIATMTRGHDKRVYYVKQNVETNISQTLMNVISQIKKSNFGLRQIESMNNILNITGRFNDYVIPIGQSGDAPIQFEVMQGQNIETNTDLLDRLTDQAIGGIVPRELVDTMRGIDFSSQITSTNLQFIRKIFNRQSLLEEQLSEFFTCIYNYEYGTQIEVKCSLPAPIFLQMNNIVQLLQTNTDYANAMAELEFESDNSEDGQALKSLYKRNIVRHNLASYIKIGELDAIREATKQEYEIIKAQKKKEDE
ncbi:MAG: hypothetical protein PHC62_00190 [Candidatus Izemoplasmatales bacterium]|nr:hypothetical protein [Candidatus Izemoplasmatales bacterium]